MIFVMYQCWFLSVDVSEQICGLWCAELSSALQKDANLIPVLHHVLMVAAP